MFMVVILLNMVLMLMFIGQGAIGLLFMSMGGIVNMHPNGHMQELFCAVQKTRQYTIRINNQFDFKIQNLRRNF